MTRQTGIKVVNKFQRGLITETTGLNFPEDAVTDTMNVTYDPQSIARRRKGIDFEVSRTFTAAPHTNMDNRAITEFYWRGAAGNANLNYVVVQLGRYLWFFNTNKSSISRGKATATVDLGPLKVSGAPDVSTQPCEYAVGNNYLFVTHPYCDPFYVERGYSAGAETFTATRIRLEIRDFEGIDDELDIDERPTNITAKHRYNLKNQGWPDTVQVGNDGNDDTAEPISYFRNTLATGSFYPSNADIWWLFKSSEDLFEPQYLGEAIAIGNTPAPKGHYILKAFYQDRSAISGIGNFGVTTSGYWRPSVCAFFAGRVWYSGVNHRKFTNQIYFSKIAEDERDYAKCYQQNDPTSEHANDLLPSDGGVIKIPDMGIVYKMIPIQTSLLIFASNGVWSVMGSEGLGFRANDYSIRKISNTDAVSSSSFADVEGFAVWWNNSGIQSISTDNLGNMNVTSLTDQTIQEFYEDIPILSKQYAKASYDSLNKLIYWIYRSEPEPIGVFYRYHYDRVLTYNLITQAWSVWSVNNTFDESNTYGGLIHGLITVKGRGTVDDEVVVTDSLGNTVQDVALNDVVVNGEVSEDLSSVVKFLSSKQVSGAYHISFAEEYDTQYVDWTDLVTDGIAYDSYFVSGYNLDGQAANYFQTNYVLVYCNELSGSGVFMQGIFDWANTGNNTGKWSVKQQAYLSSPTQRGVRVSKLKNRGRGRSIQLRFSNDGNKPFEVIGWGLVESSNKVV